MLRNTKDLKNLAIRATNGDIGQVKDMYFDDDAWVLRYFVVETGSWLSSRKVLVSPIAVLEPDWQNKTLPVSLSIEQVDKSPGIDTDKPVSRQHETLYFDYYGYPYYWGGQGLWAERQREDEVGLGVERAQHRQDDPHLRSCDAVVSYHVQAGDGEIGHIAGFLVDEVNWAIRYLVVDTSNWLMGRKVLIAPAWISGVHWSTETVSVDLSRAAIQASPVFDPDAVMDRAWELHLHQHDGRTGYWTRAQALATPR